MRLVNFLTNNKKIIKLPLNNVQEIFQFTAGDFVHVTGEILIFRDQVHKKIASGDMTGLGQVSLINSGVYYCAPTPAKPGQVIGSCGPTSSYRMDSLTKPVLELGLKVMIGKGYRSQELVSMCYQYKAIYIITFGGCGAFLNKYVQKAEVVGYPELKTEALWKFTIKEFPGIVGIDAFGNTLWSKFEKEKKIQSEIK